MATLLITNLLILTYYYTLTASACTDSYTYKYIRVPNGRNRGLRRYPYRFSGNCGLFCGSSSYLKIKQTQTITCANVTKDFYVDYNYTTGNYHQSLVIEDSSVPVIPSNSSLSKFPGIDRLTLKNLSIEGISNGAFRYLPQVEDLDLSWNKLVDVPEEVLALPNLKHLNLSSNQLEVISTDLQYLESIDISNNPMVDLGNASFKSLKRLIATNMTFKRFDNDLSNLDLDSVDLSNGVLEFINFDNLRKSKILALQNNRISEVNNWNTIKSDKIFLSNNYITRLENIPENIKNLNLSVNQISTIGRNNANSKIEILDLHSNNISEIDTMVFWNLKNLENLNLNSNNLETLRESTFVNCTSLQKISISYNGLKYIESNVFSGVPLLITIDLSHNRLKSLNYFMLPVQNKVANLYIDHNEISTLDIELFNENFSKLTLITVTNNSWFCEDLKDILYNFKLREIFARGRDFLNINAENSVEGIYCKFNKKS